MVVGDMVLGDMVLGDMVLGIADVPKPMFGLTPQSVAPH
jgi:hypothetical protein